MVSPFLLMDDLQAPPPNPLSAGVSGNRMQEVCPRAPYAHVCVADHGWSAGKGAAQPGSRLGREARIRTPWEGSSLGPL